MLFHRFFYLSTAANHITAGKKLYYADVLRTRRLQTAAGVAVVQGGSLLSSKGTKYSYGPTDIGFSVAQAVDQPPCFILS